MTHPSTSRMAGLVGRSNAYRPTHSPADTDGTCALPGGARIDFRIRPPYEQAAWLEATRGDRPR